MSKILIGDLINMEEKTRILLEQFGDFFPLGFEWNVSDQQFTRDRFLIFRRFP